MVIPGPNPGEAPRQWLEPLLERLWSAEEAAPDTAQVLVTRRRAAASAILDYARPRGTAADMRACPGESARTVGPAGQPAGPI